MKSILTGILLSAALVTTACHKRPGDDQADGNMAASAMSTPAATAPAAAPTVGQVGPATPVTKFDMASVPLSTTKLGGFPYLSLPDGYEASNASTLGMAKVPYWVGDHFEWIEGKVYQSDIRPKTGTDFSGYEVKRNIEALVEQAGGKKVFEGTVPSEAGDKVPDEVRRSLNIGMGSMYSETVDVYLIHQADKDIWVHFSSNTSQGSWAVTETKPFVPTAKLLPATALKTSLDTSGRATIHINFAFDKADLLPDAKPQIAEVAKLMGDPGLKLSIEGHTDNVGVPTHNLLLSEARARAVMASLISGHVAAGRLSAKGFGANRPVATNDTEAGRAQNRRVDLVRV